MTRGREDYPMQPCFIQDKKIYIYMEYPLAIAIGSISTDYQLPHPLILQAHGGN